MYGRHALLIFITLISILIFTVLLGIIAAGMNESSTSQAEKMIREGKYENAAKILKKEITRDPANTRAFLHLGDCYFNQGNYDDAMSNYMYISRANSIMSVEERTHIYSQLSYIYKEKNRYENRFEMSLKILRINPEDYGVNQNVAYELIRLKRFDLATPYLEKILKTNPRKDMQDLIAYFVVLFYNGQPEEAREKIHSVLANTPNNIHLNLLLIATFQKEGFRDGINHIKKIFSQVKDENIMRLLVRLYSYFIYQMKPKMKSLDFIIKIMDHPEHPKNVRREAHYFYLFFLAKVHEMRNINKDVEKFETSYGKYGRISELKKNLVTEDETLQESMTKSEDISRLYQKEMEAIMPADFLLELSGFQADHLIDLARFFDFPNETSATLKDEFQKPDMQTLLDRYYELSSQHFLRFTRNACGLMGLKILQSLKIGADGHTIAYICSRGKERTKVSICFLQCVGNTNLSDIFIQELVRKGNTYRVQESIFISNGKLTEDAQEEAKLSPNLKIIQGDELYELLFSLLG